MTLVIVLFAALFAISHSDSSFVHPSGIAVITGQTAEDLDCGPVGGSGLAPGLALDTDRPSRATNLGMLGKYECRRSVFSYDERNPFIERLLKTQSVNAKRVATEVDSRLRGESRLLFLEVEGIDDQKLLNAVAAVYRNELNQALGKGRVVRLAIDKESESVEAVKAGHLVLIIQVRRVDDAELMVQARLTTGAAKRRGELEWLEL